MTSAAQVPRPPTEWHFLNSGFCNGAVNMQVDESLARSLSRGAGISTLRVYGWAPHAVSLGYHQQRSDIDEEKCAGYGIDIVRRPTGGRAILHAEELTYSVVMEGDGRSISAVYAEISRALVAGLRRLGADVEFATTQPDFGTLYQSPTSIPCFSSSSRFEIQSAGKKLAGSAQRRYLSAGGGDIVLQHGSILLGPGHRLLSELIHTEDPGLRNRLRAQLQEKTTDLSAVLHSAVAFDDVAAAIRSGFEETWDTVMTDADDEAAGVVRTKDCADSIHTS